MTSGGGGSTRVTDSGLPTGVADEYHTQHFNQTRGDARYLQSARTLTAGAGLTGGGDLSADRTFTVGAGLGITVNADDVALTTPGTLTVSSTNSASGSHTHAVTASDNPGAAASLLKSTSGGALTLVALTATTSVDTATATATTEGRTPTIDTASGALALSPNSGTVNVTSTLAAANLTASADFTTSRVAGHLIPKLTDTYDLGSSTLLWRKGWLRELDTNLFAENTISLLGGWFYVTPDAGTLAADVTVGATTVDFGKAMTPGAFM